MESDSRKKFIQLGGMKEVRSLLKQDVDLSYRHALAGSLFMRSATSSEICITVDLFDEETMSMSALVCIC